MQGFRFLVLKTHLLSFLHCFFLCPNIIRKLLVNICWPRAHLIVVQNELFTIFRYFKSSFELIVIHNTLLESVVVLGAIDRILLQVLQQVIMMPPIIVLIFNIPLVERFVIIGMFLQANSSDTR